MENYNWVQFIWVLTLIIIFVIIRLLSIKEVPKVFTFISKMIKFLLPKQYTVFGEFGGDLGVIPKHLSTHHISFKLSGDRVIALEATRDMIQEIEKYRGENITLKCGKIPFKRVPDVIGVIA